MKRKLGNLVFFMVHTALEKVCAETIGNAGNFAERTPPKKIAFISIAKN